MLWYSIKYIYYGCTALAEVFNHSSLNIVKGSTSNGYVTYYAKVVAKYKDENSFYYNDEAHTQLAAYTGSALSVVIPSSVTSIAAGGFDDCPLASLTVGTNVSSVEKNAFSNCSIDKVIWLPNTEPGVTGRVTYVSTSNVSTSKSLKRMDFLSSMFEVDGVKYVPLSLSDRTCMAIDYDYNKVRSNVPLNSQVVYRNVAFTLKGVGNYAFSRADSIKVSNIPAAVESVGEYAFNGCTALEDISIDDCASALSVSNGVFGSCPLKSVYLGRNLAYSSDSPFEGKTNLTKAVLSDNVTTLPNRLFYGCTALPELTIPSSVTSIGNYALYNCVALSGITIPSSVTSVGEAAFYGCKSLADLRIEDSKESLPFGKYNFDEISLESLYLGRDVNIIFKGQSKLAKAEISDNVTKIDDDMFNDCTALADVSIGNSVASIGNRAFMNCKMLADIVIPDCVQSLGVSAFEECQSLETISLPMTDVGAYAFKGCSSLASVALDPAMTVIKESTFERCSSLGSITLPASLTTIEKRAFMYSGLTAVSIPDAIRVIKESTFEGCGQLATAQFGNDLRTICSRAFYGTGLMALTFSQRVETIESECFRNCKSLKSINVEVEGHLSFGSNCFSGCTVLETVNMGRQKVITLGDYCFSGCISLPQITIVNCGAIGQNCFSDCTALKNMYLSELAGSIGSNVLKGATSFEKVSVSSLNNWMDINFQDETANPIYYCHSLHVGDKELVDLTVSKYIKKYAFYSDWALKSVSFSNSCSSIGAGAFEGCRGLNEVVIPASIERMDGRCFADCTAMKEAVFVDGERDLNIANDVFSGTPLESVRIGRDLTYPSSSYTSPFAKMNTLTSAWITDIPTKAGEYLFYDCENLKDVSVGDDVETIGEYAFSGCKSIGRFAFGRNVREIKREAFSDCTGMTNIYAEPTVPPVCYAQALDDIDHWACTLHVPTAAAGEYAVADQWKEFLFVDNEFGITLDRSAASMKAGERLKLTAQMNNAAQTRADVGVSWISTNTDIVTVDDDGMVEAVGGGRTSVFAITSDGLMANCIVEVDGATGIVEIEDAEHAVAKGCAISIAGCTMTIGGLAEGEVVSVYAIDGRVLYRGTGRTVEMPSGQTVIVCWPGGQKKLIVK